MHALTGENAALEQVSRQRPRASALSFDATAPMKTVWLTALITQELSASGKEIS
jgi:hypothetical protein